VVDPKPPRLATPHSCASTCSRSRICGHPCPLPCHPGPCPPCGVTTSVPCHCGKHTRSFRCSNLAPSRRSEARAEMSCGETCNRKLSCGNHTCSKVCHPGDCGPCEVKVASKCWCGKEERELGCGEGEPKHSEIISASGQQDHWIGQFQCDNTCDR
jgi:transcriptional repressor NF-X1